jgi:hypothetical protein
LYFIVFQDFWKLLIVYMFIKSQVSDSYSLKWDAMKAKRDKMYDQEDERELRSDMLTSLNRLVINSEK